MQQQSLLVARGLAKIHGQGAQARTVLHDLDLDLAAGEVLAVLGRSGSGKSTLLNLVGAMARPTRGTIVFDGQDLGRLGEAALTRFRRRELGFVFQAYNLLPSLTVRENVELPLELNGVRDRARVDALLERLGLADLAGRHPDQLSGGEQQRTAIARAVVHRPRLVLADEPTGNLDEDNGREVVALFEACAREDGAALMMATHSRDMLGHADRVLAVRDGRLQAP